MYIFEILRHGADGTVVPVDNEPRPVERLCWAGLRNS